MNDIIIPDQNDIILPDEEKEEKVKYLTESDVKRVIENAKPCYKVVFSLLYELGARINEVLNLKYSDIKKINYKGRSSIRTDGKRLHCKKFKKRKSVGKSYKQIYEAAL